MKTLKNTWHELLKNRSSKTLLLSGLLLATIGAAWAAFAITPRADTVTTASFQAEGATRSGNVSIVSDAAAAGSGAVKFGVAGQPGSCPGVANMPGSADPWGGCWPGPHNTGYPKGLPGDTRTPVALTPYTGHLPNSDGEIVINTCGVVIDSKTINASIRIIASNGTHSAATPCVTIKNSFVRGWIHTDHDGQGPLVITDTEIDAGTSNYWASLGFYNTFGWRINSYGGHSTLKCAAFCGYYDSWVHGVYISKDSHGNSIGSNGMEAGGVNDVWYIQHNYMDCADFSGRVTNIGDGGCSADLGLYGDFGPIKNITVHRNYFAPAKVTSQYPEFAQPGYCFNSANDSASGKPYKIPQNLIVTENVFGRGAGGKCGSYGPHAGWSYGTEYGNVWSGNKWDDGSILNP